MDFNPELQDVSRQRKLADLLMAQGMQQPQGQMISGHYVAPSFTQQLNPLANILAGQAIGEKADIKQTELATALRGKKLEVQKSIQEKIDSGDLNGALAIATQNSEYGGKDFIAPLMANRIPKAQEPKVVGNRLVDATGKVLFTAPKEYAPHANQLVPVQGGFAEYNPNTKTLTPIGGGQGGATGALMPPLPSHIQSEVTSINQQKASINDALKTVEKNKDAFGPKFAAPGIIAGEYGTSRMNEKMPSSQVEARAKVFNIASSVIKERAGTAQSKQEQAIIMRFLPSPFDGEKAITDKFNAFNDYLTSKEQGMTSTIGAVPSYRPSATQTPSASTSNKTQNFDPALLQFMTPEQQALFKQPGN
jgi:hypothetical protein